MVVEQEWLESWTVCPQVHSQAQHAAVDKAACRTQLRGNTKVSEMVCFLK